MLLSGFRKRISVTNSLTHHYRENFRRGITPNIRGRKGAMANATKNGGVEMGSNGSNGAAEPFLKGSKEDEEEMEKEQKRRKEVQKNLI